MAIPSPIPTLLKPGNEVKPPDYKLVGPDYNMAGSDFHHVKDGDNWYKVADQHEVDVKELLMWNFNTLDPYEINWYLRQYVGCNKTTPDKFNYVFSTVGADYRGAHTGRVYIPRMSIQVGEIPDPKPLPPPPPEEPKWTTLEFWVSGESADLVYANRLNAGVMMRFKNKPWYCYYWPFSISLFGASLGWSGVSKFSTTVTPVHVHIERWDPRKLFEGLRIEGQMYGNVMDFTIHGIFPWDQFGGKPTPIKNHLDPQLRLKGYTGDGPGDVHLGGNKSIITGYLRTMGEGPTPPSPDGSTWG